MLFSYYRIFRISKNNELKINHKMMKQKYYEHFQAYHSVQTPLNDSWTWCLCMQLRVRGYVISHFVLRVPGSTCRQSR